MNQNVLTTNTTKPSHVHIRATLKSWDYGHIYYATESRYDDLKPADVLDTFLFELTKTYKCTKSQTNYSVDEVGETEYFKCSANVRERDNPNVNYRLTVHVFSCYCEPLNENQDPPF